MSTYTIYDGNGIRTSFPIPFPYTAQSQVKAFVDGVEVSFSFIDANNISVVPAPAVGTKVTIRRITPSASPAVEFNVAEARTGADLDKAFRQPLQVATEAFDMAKEALLGQATLSAAAVSFQEGIDQLAAAQATAQGVIDTANDLASQAQAYATSASVAVGQALSHRNDAQSAATQAEAARAEAVSKAATVASQLTTVNTKATEVAAAVSSAEASATTATTQAGLSTTARTQSEAARDAAVIAKNAAETAAQNAQAAAGGAGTVKASNTDTTVGTLMSKINVSGGITKTLQNAGNNETILLTVTATGSGGASSASDLTVTPAGNITSTNAQAALQELDTKKANTSHTHTASSVSVAPSGSITTNTVQAALQELDTGKAATGHTHAAQTATNTPSTATGSITATNVQAAIAELDTKKQAVTAALTALLGATTVGILVRTGTDTYASRSIGVGSNKLAIANGTGSGGNISLDVNEANLSLANIGGTLPVNKGGTGSTDAAAAVTALGITPANIGALASGATAADSSKWGGSSKTVSTAAPSGGADGDIWFEREA